MCAGKSGEVGERESALATTAAQVAVKESPNPELTRADRIGILEGLARVNVNLRERIQAIRLLKEMRGRGAPGRVRGSRRGGPAPRPFTEARVMRI